jgi:hypothetical protein
MRKIWRCTLAPLALGAAIFTAAAPAAHAATAGASVGASQVHPADCPGGTHWDDQTHTCVPN